MTSETNTALRHAENSSAREALQQIDGAAQLAGKQLRDPQALVTLPTLDAIDTAAYQLRGEVTAARTARRLRGEQP